MKRNQPSPLPPCKVCKTNHGDAATRDESCKVFQAEVRISHLYHNNGTAYEIRLAQAQRQDALGDFWQALKFYGEAVALASNQDLCICDQLPHEQRTTGHHPNCHLWDCHAGEVEE